MAIDDIRGAGGSMRKRSEVGPGVARSAEDVREVPRVKPSPLEFPTAQPVATHDLDPGFARIVETLVVETLIVGLT